MKQNIAKVLTFSLLATSAVFISCVDNEKNLFDAEQLRQIYEETFPVKNICLNVSLSLKPAKILSKSYLLPTLFQLL